VLDVITKTDKTETRKLFVSICGRIKLVFVIQNVSMAMMNAAPESIIDIFRFILIKYFQVIISKN